MRLRRLISTFVIHLLESTISKLASSEISIFYLVSVAEETGSSLAFSENPEDRFSRDEAHTMSRLGVILGHVLKWINHWWFKYLETLFNVAYNKVAYMAAFNLFTQKRGLKVVFVSYDKYRYKMVSAC